MKKQELARAVARSTGVTRAEAADQVDRVVNEILQKLRNGQTARMPGFGEFSKRPDGTIEFLREKPLAPR